MEDLPCVHCGLCLDACPTYREMGTEADSPRGRLYLMDAISSGEVAPKTSTLAHIDRCLGCLACETACPSGVRYGHRLETFRASLPSQKRPRLNWHTPWHSLLQWLLEAPGWVTFGANVAVWMDRLGLEPIRRRFPALGVLPGRRVPNVNHHTPAVRRSRQHQPADPKARVALLTGCVADVLLPDLTRTAVEVLQRNDIEVFEVTGQGCCGALALHSGQQAKAETQATNNTQVFAAAIRRGDLDYLVTTASGCGYAMSRYDELLAFDPALAEDARLVASRTRDVCDVLVEFGIRGPFPDSGNHPTGETAADDDAADGGPVTNDHSASDTVDTDQRSGGDKSDGDRPGPASQPSGNRPSGHQPVVAYHDACHLLHGLGSSAAPRAVCRAALGYDTVDLGDNSICCGSAGTYNLEQPGMAAKLGNRKAELAAERQADIVVVANAGCRLQIERSLRLKGIQAPVLHPLELLAQQYDRHER